MKLLEIVDLVYYHIDPPDENPPFVVAVPDERGHERQLDAKVTWALFHAACASISGFLDDLERDGCPETEVKEAVAHGRAIFEAGIVDESDVKTVMVQAWTDLREWGRSEEFSRIQKQILSTD